MEKWKVLDTITNLRKPLELPSMLSLSKIESPIETMKSSKNTSK